MLYQVPKSIQIPCAIFLCPPSHLVHALLLIAHTCDFIQMSAFGLPGVLWQNKQSAESAGELTSLGVALSHRWTVWRYKSPALVSSWHKLWGVIYTPKIPAGSGWGCDCVRKLTFAQLLSFSVLLPALPYRCLPEAVPSYVTCSWILISGSASGSQVRMRDVLREGQLGSYCKLQARDHRGWC